MMSIPEALGMAWQSFQAGQLPQAEHIFRQILQVDPNQVDALHLMGIIELQMGRADQAIEYLHATLRVAPDFVEAHNNLGMAFQAQGRFAEAVPSHQQSVRLRPEFPEAHSNLGRALQALGKLPEAVQSYQEATRLRPEAAELHYNLAIALRQQGKWAEAAAALEIALRLRPDFTDALVNLAVALQMLGKPDEAVKAYERALVQRPDSADTHLNLAVTLQTQGKVAEAITHYHHALRLRPDFPEAYVNLAVALQAQGKLDEAVVTYERALRIKPDSAEAHFNLGSARQAQGKLNEAVASYERALRLKANYAEAHNNLGNTLREMGQHQEAVDRLEHSLRLMPNSAETHVNLAAALQEQGNLADAARHLDEAIRLRPDFADAHYNRSMLWLLQGNFEQGWPEHEWRRQTKDHRGSPKPEPQWDGSPLTGKSILLYAEQGLGDTIHFIRYAAVAKELGATVVVQCQPALRKVLAGAAGIDSLHAQGDPLPRCDWYAPLLSMPARCGSTLATIPAKVPYLTVDSARVTQWRERLAGESGFKVGLCWQGNPDYKHDRWRSVPLTQFAPLADVPAVRLVCLQKGPGRDQWDNAAGKWPTANLPPQADEPAEGWLDTAAMICSLDLVVTVDTAVAHLAGALGVPVWVALPFAPDWRWLLERQDSPWYPSMWLFRQNEARDWREAFQRIHDGLEKRLAQKQNDAPAPKG
jgi:tetratricopeptide (TPR) repeat protein